MEAGCDPIGTSQHCRRAQRRGSKEVSPRKFLAHDDCLDSGWRPDRSGRCRLGQRENSSPLVRTPPRIGSCLELSMLWFAPATAARGLNPNDCPAGKMGSAFSWKLSDAAAESPGISSALAGRAAGQAVGRNFSPVAKETYLRVGEQLDFPYPPVAAAKFPLASRSAPQAVAENAHRIEEFQSFHRRIERIRHVGVNPADSRLARAPAHPARHRLIVSKGSFSLPVPAAQCQVV